MKSKATDASGYRSKRAILDRRAARMRAYNLTHGSGCKSTARAIAQRILGNEVRGAISIYLAVLAIGSFIIWAVRGYR